MTAEPTPGQRLFLRALAAHGGTGWHSPDSLAADWPADFGDRSRQMTGALGGMCVKQGWAESRQRYTHARSWKEYRITEKGRALVADSCLGSGMKWAEDASGGAFCPACLTTPAILGASPWHEIPAHPLPG